MRKEWCEECFYGSRVTRGALAACKTLGMQQEQAEASLYASAKLLLKSLRAEKSVIDHNVQAAGAIATHTKLVAIFANLYTKSATAKRSKHAFDAKAEQAPCKQNPQTPL